VDDETRCWSDLPHSSHLIISEKRREKKRKSKHGGGVVDEAEDVDGKSGEIVKDLGVWFQR